MMSKIETVRRSLNKVKTYLNDHHLHFVFFNSKSWGFSTENNCFSHEYIYKQLDDVICSGTTDFSTLIPVMETKFGEDNTTSIIISDGYHTTFNSNDNDLSNIKERLLNKFNYAIGMGTDFDQDLLSTISRQCIINNSQENIFDFMFTSKKPKIAKIPSDTFFVCDTHYIIDNSDKDIDNDFTHFDSFQHVTCKEYNVKESSENVDRFLPKKTYIFCLDVSGSMDDSFLYSNDTTTTSSNSSPTHHRFDDQYLFDKFPDDTIIQIPYLPKIGVKLFMEINNNCCYHHNILQLPSSSSLSAADEIFLVCKTIYELQYIQSKKDRMTLLYNLSFKKKFNDTNLVPFVKHTYKKLLTASEHAFNLLLNNPINEITHIIDDSTEPIAELNRKCKICYQTETNIVLSCHHAPSCFDCTCDMISSETLTLKCPICRQHVNWARQLHFRKKRNINDDERSCLKCEVNLSDVFFNPCSHILFCSTCSASAQVQCRICGLDIQSTHKIIF